jgi:hypothetical protein
MILSFTALVLVVSLVHLDRFHLSSPSTWLWLLLYAGIPANAAYSLWRSRRAPPVGAWRFGSRWQAFLLGQALTLGAYGAGLLVVPEWSAAFWPWPVDAFHARLYSAAFLTPALGTLLLIRAAARDEALALGLAQVTLGALPILGLVAVDAQVRRVDWTAGGTWLWVGALSMVFLAGVGLTRAGWPRTRPTRRLAPWSSGARPAVPARVVASFLGIAFIAAGVAGFVPALTPSPPAGAPGLALSASYGYLLGLFPVNALHSLFHLGAGILGLAAARHPATARRFLRCFAVVLGVLSIAGALPPFDTLLGLAPLFGHDVWLHGAEALAAGYVGFVAPNPAGNPEAARATLRFASSERSPRARARPDNVRREEALSA